MSNNFEQTVNLKEKMEQQRRQAERKPISQIEKIYGTADQEQTKQELQRINRPRLLETKPVVWRLVVVILAIALIGATAYWLFFRQQAGQVNSAKNQNWYAVKLVNGEIFYGQISDTKSDPVVMSNVYYNYDQTATADGKKEIPQTANLRLVKRGKETYGPSGSMNIIRVQVLYLEPLKADSKVLQAILEYEK